MLDENAAWRVLRRYAQDCLEIDGASLLAVFAIGSLPAGYYRPGQSDIDAVLVVRDGSAAMWGTAMEPSAPLAALNRRYLEIYRIPKDFGPFPVQELELYPPYQVELELVPEIARLKLQGQPVYRAFDLSTVPLPTARDFLAHAQHFEQWWRDEFSKSAPLESLPATACVNTILMQLHRFLCIKRGVIEFDKRILTQRYLECGPPFVDPDELALVGRSLSGALLSDAEIERLRRYCGELHVRMNEYLGISV
jgi:hypothetical protein